MATAGDLIGGGFGFEHTTTFIRRRAVQIPDPYNPESMVEDWSQDPSEINVSGYFSSQSSTEQSDPVREHASTLKQLIFDDPDVDVKRGDRIKQGERIWTVEGFPEQDINPWTNWQPTLVANVREGVG